MPPGQQQELDVAARGAAHFYQTAGAPDKALEILVLAEHYESAAALAEKIEQYARAGELYHEARNDKKASEMYALAGDHVRAAKLEAEYHLDHGNDEAAADALHRGGEALPAAELFGAARAIRSGRRVLPSARGVAASGRQRGACRSRRPSSGLFRASG